GEVVVDRDQVDAVAGKRVQVEGLRRDERLTFTGLHLGDVALVENDAAHHLDVEGTLAERALGSLANGRVGLEEQLLERLAVLVALLELDGLGGELLVGEVLEVRLQAGHVFRLRLQALEPPAFAEPEDFFEAAEILCHSRPRVAAGSNALGGRARTRRRSGCRSSGARQESVSGPRCARRAALARSRYAGASRAASRAPSGRPRIQKVRR